MESQTAFVLLGLLFLASAFVMVQADEDNVTYNGTEVVHEGKPWSIQCTGFDEDETIRWTRNDDSLETELASGELGVHTESGSSILSSKHARESHEGEYKCTQDSNTFHLTVYFDIKFRVLTPPDDLPLALECENKTSSNKAEWRKDEESIAEAFNDDEDAIRFNNATGVLEIVKDDESVYGKYVCRVNNFTTTYKVVPRPTATLPPSISVVEGEKLHLVCAGRQTTDAKISWSIGDKNFSQSAGRVKLTRHEDTDIYGAVLNVEDIEMTDRGNISCYVEYNTSDPNVSHKASATTTLRVKNKMAALWPFLGIVAEVVILCAIIMVYEKKRNKAELEESDTDQSPDTKPTPNKESDVRQRK